MRASDAPLPPTRSSVAMGLSNGRINESFTRVSSAPILALSLFGCSLGRRIPLPTKAEVSRIRSAAEYRRVFRHELRRVAVPSKKESLPVWHTTYCSAGGHRPPLQLPV